MLTKNMFVGKFVGHMFLYLLYPRSIGNVYKCMNIVEFPAWLKGLRLHKYSQLFQSMSYEDMLNMDEKWLEDRVSSAYDDNSSN